MGKLLDDLRREYAEEEKGRKWYQRRPKGDALLYLGARLRDVEDERKNAEALAAATKSAALKIIGRYDPEAAEQFYAEIESLRGMYLS